MDRQGPFSGQQLGVDAHHVLHLAAVRALIAVAVALLG